MPSPKPDPLLHNHQANVQKALGDILFILNSDLDRFDLFKEVGLAIKPIIPFDRFSVSLQQLRFWFYLENGKVTTERDHGFFDENSSASTWVFIHQQPFLRNDISNTLQFQYDPDLSAEQMRSDLILPLFVDGEIIGTFNFTSHKPNLYTQTHLNTAQALTNAISAVVKSVEATRSLRAIQRVQQALLDSEDMDRIFEVLIEHLHIQYDRIRVYLYDPAQNALTGRFQGGVLTLDNFTDIKLDLDEDPYSQETFAGSGPKIYRTDTPKYRWIEKSQVKHTLEWAEIPLKVHHNDEEIIVGKLSLDNASTSIPLRQTDLERSMIFISQAALAIHHALLRNKMSSRVSRQTAALMKSNTILAEKDNLLSALNDVSRLSLTYLNRDAILDNFGQQIIGTGIFRSLMIALVDHNTDTIEVVRSFHAQGKDAQGNTRIRRDTNTDGMRYSLDEDNITPLTARTAKLQTIVTAEDPRLDKRIDNPDEKRWKDKIAYFIPVKREERVMAVLATGSQSKDKDQVLRHIDTMQPLLNQLGIALEHANLHHETEETAKKLQKSNQELVKEVEERRQTESALRESRQQYRTLFENMVQGFAYHEIVLDDAGKPIDYVFREVNQAFEDLTGLKLSYILNKRVTEILPGIENDPADWIGTYGNVALTGESIEFESYSEAIGRWYSISAYSPQKEHFACIFEDITQRKESEDQLQSLMAFQEEMLNTPVVWICAFEPHRLITFWNRAAELMSGYSAHEAVGSRKVWDKLYPDPVYLQKIVAESNAQIEKTGRLENFETTIQCKDGTQKTMSWQLNRLHPEDPEGGFLTIGTDITHRKQFEEDLVRIERLKALGELAAGVSHNLNNMLTGVLGPAELLKLESTDPALLANVQDIVTSATRARDLVRQLNQVVRRDVAEKLEPVELNTVINQAIRATRPRWRDEAESQGIKYHIHTKFCTSPWVSATETGIHDMLLNFIFNALDAMPRGGDITIETNSEGPNVRLSVTDTGIGMDAETRWRVLALFPNQKRCGHRYGACHRARCSRAVAC